MNSTLVPVLLAVIASEKYAPVPKQTFKKEYDYIIVGAGAAGAVVASRLSEKSCVDVLVLEAGKPGPPESEIPGMATESLATDVNWKFISEPQHYTAAQLIDRRLPLPAGRAIGGSSIVNYMMFLRGNHRDYDDWEKLGAKDWNWNKVFPYFLKLENNTDPDIANNGYHHVGGPMTASRARYTPEVKPAFMEGYESLGYELVDPNGATQLGLSDLQTFIRDGRRCSTAKAYLVSVDHRPNLDILAQAFVKKIRIRCKRAEGVYFDYNGTSHYVKAKREVIVSAGAIKTPQILMLSGVGPKETLEKFNIPLKADLPVGHNYQDHVTSIIFSSVKPPVLPFDLKLKDPSNIAEYVANRTGALASPVGVFTVSFLRSKDAVTARSVPNYQNIYLEGVNLVAKYNGFKTSTYNKLFHPYLHNASVWCLTVVLNPKSTGYVSINSTSPYDDPVIDPKYLKDPQDVKDMVAGMKTCLRVMRTRAVQQAGVKPFETLMPGCEQFADDEDKYLECYARSFVLTISHQSCTAKMGDPDDSTAVVDPKLRVKGIKGLRVVDASVMPKVVSGNTNIPTVMIAEKASDIIKKTICDC